VQKSACHAVYCFSECCQEDTLNKKYAGTEFGRPQLLPPHASENPWSWSGSTSVVWSQPSVMQIAGHTLSIAAARKRSSRLLKPSRSQSAVAERNEDHRCIPVPTALFRAVSVSSSRSQFNSQVLAWPAPRIRTPQGVLPVYNYSRVAVCFAFLYFLLPRSHDCPDESPSWADRTVYGHLI
jgi:hypothetical protein